MSEMEKLNFGFKWEQVCREKCVCPSSAFGSLQVMVDTGKPGSSAQAAVTGRGRGSACAPGSPATQIRGLPLLPAIANGCRDGDSLFLPSCTLLVAKLVALRVKPLCGDGRAGQQHLPPCPAVVQLLLPSSLSLVAAEQRMGQDGTREVAGGKGQFSNTVLMNARRCGFSCGFQGCSTGSEWV